MKRVFHIRKAVIAIVMILILSVSGVLTAYADDGYTLLLNIPADKSALSDSDFKAYRIAGAYGSEIKLSGNFAVYKDSVSTEIKTAEQVNALATTLAAYVDRDNISEDYKAAVGTAAVFSNIESGVYLITGTPAKTAEMIYTPKPVLVSVHRGAGTKTITAELKIEDTPIERKIDLEVKKVWEISKGETIPTSVKVELLKDGETYDEVTLSDSNSWHHKWSNLSAASTWQVTEKSVPEDYKVAIVLDGDTYTITNTKTVTTDDSSTPDSSEPDTPSTPDSSEPDTSSAPDSSDTDTSSVADSSEPDTPSTPDSSEPDTSSTPDSSKPDTPSTLDSSNPDTPSTSDSSKPDSSTPDTTTSGSGTSTSSSTETLDSVNDSSSGSSTDISTNDSSSSDSSSKIIVTTESKLTTNSDTTSKPNILTKLPQTGQLRWPIPVLLIAGFISSVIGVLINKSNEEKK